MVVAGREERIADVLGLVARAAESGDVEAVLDLASLLQRWYREQADFARANFDASQPIAKVLGGEPETIKPSKREALEWASTVRTRYAEKHDLRRVSRAVYVSPTGSLVVGLAASRWRSGEPTCFLGLPEKPAQGSWDLVVLLCEIDGRVLDFAIPFHDLDGVWSRLSRSSGHVKFHVQRRDGSPGRYELRIPGAAPLDLEKYLGRAVPS